MKPVTKRCQAVLSGSVSKRTSLPSYRVTHCSLPSSSRKLGHPPDPPVPGDETGRLDEQIGLNRSNPPVQPLEHPAGASGGGDLGRVVPDDAPGRPDELVHLRPECGLELGHVPIDGIGVVVRRDALAQGLPCLLQVSLGVGAVHQDTDGHRPLAVPEVVENGGARRAGKTPRGW